MSCLIKLLMSNNYVYITSPARPVLVNVCIIPDNLYDRLLSQEVGHRLKNNISSCSFAQFFQQSLISYSSFL